MDLGTWINPIYAVVFWIIMLLLVDIKRIMQLSPIGLLAVALLFAAQETAISLGLIEYQKGLVKILGIPLFQFFWAFSYGILLINFMKEEWSKKLPVIFIFCVVNEILVYFAQASGNLRFIGNFNILYDFLGTFICFSFGVWCAEGLFKDRIYRHRVKFT